MKYSDDRAMHPFTMKQAPVNQFEGINHAIWFEAGIWNGILTHLDFCTDIFFPEV